MNRKTVYPLVKNCKNKTKLARCVCYAYTYLMKSTNMQIKKMERPGRNLIAVTVVTLGVYSFFPFFFFISCFLLFVYLFLLPSSLFKHWRIISLQYCVGFCHRSTWISHRYTYVPCLLNLPSTSHHILPWYHSFV